MNRRCPHCGRKLKEGDGYMYCKCKTYVSEKTAGDIKSSEGFWKRLFDKEAKRDVESRQNNTQTK